MITCYFEDGNKAFLRHAVVDVLIVKNNKILLVKRAAKLLEGGKWATPGGYVDRDENLIQAAERETMEETGWKVAQTTLFRINSKPNRPHEDRQNISFVFFAKAVAQTGEHDWESDDIQWFDQSALPKDEDIAFDHAENIHLYFKYLQTHFTLPLFE